MFRSYKLILARKLTAIAMLLFINNLALAANIDFKTINNNASKNCTNVNGLDSARQSHKSNDAADSNETSKHEPCTNVKAEESYVEPKFSTKRPRGQ